MSEGRIKGPWQQANAHLIAPAPDLLAERNSLGVQVVELVETLEELVTRCDGQEGVRADGSNIQTMRASAVLAVYRA